MAPPLARAATLGLPLRRGRLLQTSRRDRRSSHPATNAVSDAAQPPTAGSGTATPGCVSLPGMRERAAALGGTVTAGPGRDGGFRVHAHLPRARAEVGS